MKHVLRPTGRCERSRRKMSHALDEMGGGNIQCNLPGRGGGTFRLEYVHAQMLYTAMFIDVSYDLLFQCILLTAFCQLEIKRCT